MEEVYIKENFEEVCKNWNLFRGSYWGRGCYTEPDGTDLQLFKNRDIIAERYNLKERTRCKTGKSYNIKKNLINAMIIDEETLNKNLQKKIQLLETYKEVRNKNTTITDNEINKLKIECIKKQFTDFGYYREGFNYARDHTEYYLDNDGNTISIFSIWEDTEMIEKILQNGYIEIEPIYDLNQKTFIKVIPPIPRRRRC